MKISQMGKNGINTTHYFDLLLITFPDMKKARSPHKQRNYRLLKE